MSEGGQHWTMFETLSGCGMKGATDIPVPMYTGVLWFSRRYAAAASAAASVDFFVLALQVANVDGLF